MSYRLSATVVGADELKDAFDKCPELAQTHFKTAISRSAQGVNSRAKAGAPVRYGALRGSIHTEGPTVTPNNVTARVGTNLKYARWQEEGTGVYAGHGPIRPKNGRVLAWKSGGRWIYARAVKGIKGKFFFKQAVEGSQATIDRNMSQALQNIVAALAKGGF